MQTAHLSAPDQSPVRPLAEALSTDAPAPVTS
jgi:hypothetical protein